MKAALILLLGACLGACGFSSNTTTPSSPASPMTSSVSETTARGSVYDFTVQTIDGKDVPLSQFKGKKLLIVNVASECGYTPQYKELEELYKKHGDRVMVLGFPANNFGGRSQVPTSRLPRFARKTTA
nr:hypothetical protein [Hymenobacter cellulosivorans]